ncbi:hypothetical protein MVES1_002435 [Malassezia vespertilionis]|uniref:Glutaredoxin domain-containing protein n=1 Tax=Malassezia vespertilionis TaxID=2020962 RepID=A0A2N1JB51_9BASI|nr:uncharacterized protein MVES1_002435 [Malassezia vespertilionis]PKI83732.1 hypothetical protein MVES_002301 [Malassezia vespertilionis]WFD07079.1 hypothetical protein MVES1_002435 [Malassezia vespertilionis]
MHGAQFETDAYALVHTIPGAIPGVVNAHTGAEDGGNDGQAYPTQAHMRVVLLEQLYGGTFSLENSVWPSWRAWLETAQYPTDAHVQFLSELIRMNGSTTDARFFLEHPVAWDREHGRKFRASVFSLTYCPYSRAAKARLSALQANFSIVEADEIGSSGQVTSFKSLLKLVTGHPTFPKVLLNTKVLLDEDGLLVGMLRDAGALPNVM